MLSTARRIKGAITAETCTSERLLAAHGNFADGSWSALEFPARFASGYSTAPVGSRSCITHAWAEVYLPEWAGSASIPH